MSAIEDWRDVMTAVQTLAEDYPDGTVIIGGVAVQMHAQRNLPPPLQEYSHDVDAMISLEDFAALRDDLEVTRNARLSKHQCEVGPIEIDLYVERQHGLRVPYEEAAVYAEQIGPFRVASVPHLLVLKLDAARARRNSAKGSKDQRDIIRLLLMFRPEHATVAARYLTDEDIALIADIASGAGFSELTSGNHHEAKRLRTRYLQSLQWIQNAA